MDTQYYKEFSSCLQRDMEFKVYGYTGVPVLVFPAQDGHFYDFENFGMIATIQDKIEQGQIQVFCCESIDYESWSNHDSDMEHRIYMQEQWYYYICHELVPRIREINRSNQHILTVGCSLGATHAANFMFRRPDLFFGTIAMSGYYDSDIFFQDFCNEHVYDNAPIRYLGGMSLDHPYIEQYRQCKIIISCGQGNWEEEMLRSTYQLRDILNALNIPAWVDIWGNDVHHDWPWWRKQFPYFIEEILK